MKDLLRKSMLLGIGAASLTRKKAEKVARELVRKGAVSSREGETLVKKVLSETKKQQAKMRKTGEAEAKKALKKMGIISIDEARKLKKRVEFLEKRIRDASRKTAKKAYAKARRVLG